MSRTLSGIRLASIEKPYIPRRATMRKVFSAAACLMLALSVTACAAGNTTRTAPKANQGTDHNNQATGGTQNTKRGMNTTTAGNTLTRGGTSFSGGSAGSAGAGNTAGVGTGARTPAARYKDGVFTGQGDPKAYGNEEASVFIRGGKIVDIVLTKIDLEGTVLTYETTGFEGLRNSIKSAVLAQQSPQITLPNTVTSTNQPVVQNWLLAIRRALDQASS